MSSAVSALNSAVYAGYVKVEELGLRGMITLRGDIPNASFSSGVKTVLGVAVPEQRGISFSGDTGLAWMSPDELLVLVPYGKAEETVVALGQKLKSQHHLAVNVSDARAMFALSGDRVREVMAKLAPVDMAAGAFEPGKIRRTRMAQVPAAFWMHDERTVKIICFRSVAQYMFDLLQDAAEPGGEVNIFN